MKEKIIDFSNGVFEYCQTSLKTEPQELVLELEAGKSVQGSFIVSSCDERRVKGILYHRIPGLTLKGDSFFARAARIEFTFEAGRLRAGEGLEDRIWLETSAGEYELPVQVRIRGRQEEVKEELPLPPAEEPEEPKESFRKGPGRSEAWIAKRRQSSAIVGIQLVLEQERRNGCTKEEADVRLRELADALVEADPESSLYPLLDAMVMLREERREEAGWILRKYERTRLFQQRDRKVSAVFLYVNSRFRQDEEVTASCVAQLQKMYQKHPEDGLITAFLLELDPKLKKNARTRYMVLERQFRAGTRNRLLYQEAWKLLREDMALFTRLDGFTLQIFGWAADHGFLTAEAAQIIAAQAARLKNWSLLAAGLLKACYQVSPSRETAGAVCSVYIRGHRMDSDAFVWYKKGVELDAKITNLYEYFMYALPENYNQLLPRQVFLYFQYHNTLTNRQKTALFCNLIRYGKQGEELYESYRRQLQEFLRKQLRERRLNEDLAWLYGKCLLAETLEEDLLEALADVLFLRKLTCREKRIRQAEVSYEQLEQKVTVPLASGCAWIPVYTPGARIVLLDEYGNRYEKTVPYDLKRVMIEPGFLQLCTVRLKEHLGLNLYLLDGKGRHRLKEDNVELAWKLMADGRISEDYRRRLQLELLDYERRHHRLEQMDERLRIPDPDVLTRKDQAAYIEALTGLRQDEEAFALLKKTGCREVEPKSLLRLLQRLMTEEKADREALVPYACQVFEKGVYTEKIIELLTGAYQGSTMELLALWKAGNTFGMSLPELEEQILVQALFTRRYVNEVFPVYLSMDDRGGDSVIGTAYLNYLGWLDFVKGAEVPEGLFDSLEHHLLWEDRLAETSVLSYLKQLSVLLLLTDIQKRLVQKLLGEQETRRRRFAFVRQLLPYVEEKGRPNDQRIVEYRCDPGHKVVIHYVLEYHGKKTFDYVTECLYPVCGGVFTKAFVLFYGERLTWFFTETAEDGTERSTECHTIENREEHMEGDSRYHRLCRMQRALDYQQERSLKRMMAEYEELTELVEEQFCIRQG
ncbi:MAG: hypothetical protein KH452_03645 [Clostridiales bacterium]|nr:hypothetical protein [Clostridiales bacterium]